MQDWYKTNLFYKVIGIITGGRMKRPLVIISIAYVTGIIIGVYLKNSISFIFAVNLMLTLILIINKLVRFIKIKNIYENIILLILITLA